MSVYVRLVDGVSCPAPSTCDWTLADNSAEDAGRVQDGNDTMYKNRTSQKRKLALTWNGTDPAKTSQILQMFNPEYISVTYIDALANTEQTRQFYTGDRKASVAIWTVNNKRYSSVSLDIIER